MEEKCSFSLAKLLIQNRMETRSTSLWETTAYAIAISALVPNFRKLQRIILRMFM